MSVAFTLRRCGIISAVAKNIVTYREENGVFTNRKELLKVSKLGTKAYEQCAGFMQIARTTVQRIYEIARKKVADAIIDGHPLRIEGVMSIFIKVQHQ